MKTILFGRTLEELNLIAEQEGQKSFVAKQISNWLYKKNVADIDRMTDLSLRLRNSLKEKYSVGLVPYTKRLVSKDSTVKYLFVYPEDAFVEAVVIFDKERATLCISTQAGCRMNCGFCATGHQGFNRNLTCFEILNIYRNIEEYSSITNIVYMGMGEPLDNWLETKKSLEILTSDYGYSLSPRRITVSTCGYMPNMKSLIEQTNVDIAISLHNPIAEQRKNIMPIEKAFPVKDVIELLKQYNWKGQRHLTFEYIVFDGLNNSITHAKALANLLQGLCCRINLIKFHTIPDTIYIGAGKRQMDEFCKLLKSKGFNTNIRASKGEDIQAACGLLSYNSKTLPRK